MLPVIVSKRSQKDGWSRNTFYPLNIRPHVQSHITCYFALDVAYAILEYILYNLFR